MEIIVATTNRHKLGELQALFPNDRLLLPADVGHPGFDVEEDGETYLENAVKKAMALFRLTGRPALADDSGLSVRAMGGGPGVRSARYGSPDGRAPLDSPARNALLLRAMEGVGDRACAFVCCLALVLDADRVFTAQETCPGILLDAPRGAGGFGYDPIVYLPRFGKTVAELEPEVKNRVSHRGRASAVMARTLEALEALEARAAMEARDPGTR